MPNARKNQFHPGAEGTFHCWSRCVRRAFLMGKDPATGIDYDHRRNWVYERLDWICEAFCIDVLFFALMTTHFHIVLKSQPRLAKRLSAREVARRWLMLFPGKRVLDGPPPMPTEEQILELAADKKRIKKLRRRLSDISWFMRALKEPISRRANLEDGCTGAFFASRFGCRRVEDAESRLAIGLYADLNPFRAGECELPWQSPYCSAGLRFRALQGEPAPKWLAEFQLLPGQREDEPSARGGRATDRGCLEMPFEHYLQLLTWAAAEPKPGKRTLPPEVAELITRHGLHPDRLEELLEELPQRFPQAIGRVESLRELATRQQRRWVQGVGQAARYFRVHPGADQSRSCLPAGEWTPNG